jgi:hypothetical protein
MTSRPTRACAPGSPPPHTYKLIREVEAALDKSPGSRLLISQLKEAHKINESVQSRRRSVKMESIIGRADTKENDLIISSFGKHPFELKRPTESQQALHESVKGKSKISFTMNERTAQTSTAKFADDPVTEGSPPHPSQPTPITEADGLAYRKWIN